MSLFQKSLMSLFLTSLTSVLSISLTRSPTPLTPVRDLGVFPSVQIRGKSNQIDAFANISQNVVYAYALRHGASQFAVKIRKVLAFLKCMHPVGGLLLLILSSGEEMVTRRTAPWYDLKCVHFTEEIKLMKIGIHRRLRVRSRPVGRHPQG